MKHRLILPCLLLAVALATAGLSGCGAASRTPAPEFSSGADAAPSPDAAETASPAPVTGEVAWPVPETGIDFAPIQDFAPAGVVRAISDSQPGAGSDTGYYAIDRLQDGSARITFVDYATKQQIVLCSQPNCTHTSDACPAWYSYDNALRVYPLGDQLVVLQGGSFLPQDWLGDRAVPRVDILNADGSGRHTAFTFPSGCWVSTMPHYHMARDDENLYFVIQQTTEAGDRQAILCAAHAASGQVFALCGLPEDETHLIGGTDGTLVLEYTPGINESMDAAPADTQVVQLDLATRQRIPLTSYPFGSALTACDSEMFYLLSAGKVCSINLVDGSTAVEMPLTLPEGCSSIQRMYGVFDGRLVAATWTDGAMNTPGGLRFFAIDPTTGARTDLPYTTGEENALVPCQPLAETDTDFLCLAEQTSIAVTVAGAPEGQGQGSAAQYRYALVPKADFWAGTADMTPLPLN